MARFRRKFDVEQLCGFAKMKKESGEVRKLRGASPRSLALTTDNSGLLDSLYDLPRTISRFIAMKATAGDACKMR
jgi:hypothetical protein